MTWNQTDVALIKRLCLGNEEAMDFLANYWARYCHEIDDIVDGERTKPEEILATFALAIGLYSHPFYLKNAAALRQVAFHVTATYAQTVAWEKDQVDWRRQWADMHRHCSNDMAQAVAMICGGYEHARLVLPELRAMAYADHHDEKGQPV